MQNVIVIRGERRGMAHVGFFPLYPSKHFRNHTLDGAVVSQYSVEINS